MDEFEEESLDERPTDPKRSRDNPLVADGVQHHGCRCDKRRFGDRFGVGANSQFATGFTILSNHVRAV